MAPHHREGSHGRSVAHASRRATRSSSSPAQSQSNEPREVLKVDARDRQSDGRRKSTCVGSTSGAAQQNPEGWSHRKREFPIDASNVMLFSEKAGQGCPRTDPAREADRRQEDAPRARRRASAARSLTDPAPEVRLSQERTDKRPMTSTETARTRPRRCRGCSEEYRAEVAPSLKRASSATRTR